MSGGRKKRIRRAQDYRLAMREAGVGKFKCENCGEMILDGHFFPPCLGEEGFYTCRAAPQVQESDANE